MDELDQGEGVKSSEEKKKKKVDADALVEMKRGTVHFFRKGADVDAEIARGAEIV